MSWFQFINIMTLIPKMQILSNNEYGPCGICMEQKEMIVLHGDQRHSLCSACYSKIYPTNSCPYCRTIISNRVNIGSLFYSRPYDYHRLSCEYYSKVFKILKSEHETNWLCWCTIHTLYDCINSDNLKDIEKYLKSPHSDCETSSRRLCGNDITYDDIHNLTTAIVSFNKLCSCGGYTCEIYWDDKDKKLSVIETDENPTNDSDSCYEEYVLDHIPTFREVIFDIINCSNSSMLTNHCDIMLDDLVNSGKVGKFEYELGMD